VDRAIPGDRVIVKPGFYSAGAVIRRGGTADAPLLVQAEQRGTVIIDGGRECDHLFEVHDAPHVTIDGFELRWFKSVAVTIQSSSNVIVRHCMIWNEPWLKGSRRTGSGILAEDAPNVEVDHCVFFALNRALLLRASPGFRVTHNTATALLHGVVTFQCEQVQSVNGVCINNSFAFGGSYQITLIMSDNAKNTLTCDDNNVAMFLRPSVAAQVPAEEVLEPRDGDFQYYLRGVKAVGSDYGRPVPSLKEWRAMGYGRNSIMKRPLYVDPWNHDFRLKPGSPNIGAGKDGATIGAMGVVLTE
jgi:hypothetical protein